MSYLEQHRDEIFKKYNNESLFKDVDSYRNRGGAFNKSS